MTQLDMFGLPLEVALCPDCDGTGMCADARWPDPCPRCKGSGLDCVNELTHDDRGASKS
jgi:DnaJ-class molecular chaperone